METIIQIVIDVLVILGAVAFGVKKQNKSVSADALNSKFNTISNLAEAFINFAYRFAEYTGPQKMAFVVSSILDIINANNIDGIDEQTIEAIAQYIYDKKKSENPDQQLESSNVDEAAQLEFTECE